MSTVKQVGVIRFKFQKKFSSFNELLAFAGDRITQPLDVEVREKWVNGSLVSTDEIALLDYPQKKGTYRVLKDYHEDGVFYLDYHLIDTAESCDDIELNISIVDLMAIYQSVSKIFGDDLGQGHVVIYEWYTGSDEPISY